METDTSAQDRRELPDSVVRAQLERVLASEVFSRSQQLRRLLSFIVEQRLAGQGHSLKESVLAHEVYGKGTDFDGGADPVVRVDARRLRDKLREYYDGRSDPVVITLPKGSYVPVFEANSASPTHTAPPVVHAEPEQQQTPPVPNFRLTRIAVSALAIVAAIVAAALAWRALARPVSAPIQLLPLASYQGVEGPPALSPDGDLVAFAWSGQAEAGATDIYVKAVGSEALRRLTATPNSESSPAWSPDGHSSPSSETGTVYSPCPNSAAPNARYRHPALRSRGLVTRSRFSSVTGNGTPVPLASTRCSSTRWSVAD